jgi:hypothetical protein
MIDPGIPNRKAKVRPLWDVSQSGLRKKHNGRVFDPPVASGCIGWFRG